MRCAGDRQKSSQNAIGWEGMRMAPGALPLRQRAIWVAVASGGLALLAGCGLAANPQPPTLWLPNPPKDLTATRVGDEVHLHWTMPKETTDKVALKGDQRAHIGWITEAPVVRNPAPAGKAGAPGKTAPPVAKVGPDPCKGVGDGTFAPDKAADFP